MTDPSRRPLSARWNWRVLLPGAVLVAVAATQVMLAHTGDLSPWKGGGFGMFATLDGTSTRFVRLYVEGPERSEELELRPSLEAAAARAQLFPSRALMTALADAVAARERRHGRAVTTVRVEVWGTAFVAGPLRANERLIRELTLHVAEELPRLP